MTDLPSLSPLCPAIGRLEDTLRARIAWFVERACDGEAVSVRLMQRTEAYEEAVLGSEMWRDGELVAQQGSLALSSSRAAEDALSNRGPIWVEMSRRRLAPELTSGRTHFDHIAIAALEKLGREHYVARDGGDADSFEILETRLAEDDRWKMEIAIPAAARGEQPMACGELRKFDDEWSKPSTEASLARYPLDRVLEDTRIKMNEATYARAIAIAKDLRGPKIVELGSNFWPVIPLSVLLADPNAEYCTIDAHYNGLWTMEKLLEWQAPELLPRVHKHVMDFTDPLPLASSHFDLALAVAAFGPRHEPEDTCALTFNELHRILKPNGVLVFNGASFEERASTLLWHFLQRFEIIDQHNCGGLRTLTVRKRVFHPL